MKILVGLSNGLISENEPYQMLVVDVDSVETAKAEWTNLKPEVLSSCSNVRVNLGNYKSIMQNPIEYLEAEFDVNKLVDVSVNSREYQIINVYTDEERENGDVVLYRTVDSSGRVEMHHISEFPFKKKFSIYGEDIEELPSYVKPQPLTDAYEYWKNKENPKDKKRRRIAVESFETNENTPVQLLYHYLIGVKDFQVGYHTVTDIYNEKGIKEEMHEYFLFNGTANVKLREKTASEETEIEEVAIFGMKDPYPDTQKLGYYGATMSLVCNCKNYPTFDIYNKPTSEMSYDADGIEVTLDLTENSLDIYNRYVEVNCISKDWRLGEHDNFFGITLPSLLPDRLEGLSQKLQYEKENIDYGHWSSANTKDWFQIMGLALSTQYYSFELRSKLEKILNEYQAVFSEKLNNLIDKISAKDSLIVLRWAKENVEEEMKEISFMKENGVKQKSNVTAEQMRNLFTFKRNTYDLPDWLQIYNPDTIEKLGGVSYLNDFISSRGEDSAEIFLSIWAEKLESDQRYAVKRRKDQTQHETEKYIEENMEKMTSDFENRFDNMEEY